MLPIRLIGSPLVTAGRKLASRCWRDERGVLTFEWVLLITLVVLGVVGGLSAARDAMTSELGDVAGAIEAVDQSYQGFGTQFADQPGATQIVRPGFGSGS